MKIRRDSVFISSVLLTVALLSLVPRFLDAAQSGYDKVMLQSLDAGLRLAEVRTGQLGIVSLAIICIGLIVTWTGYVNRVRWTWFVMFIIAWAWAFPLLVLPPLFQGTIAWAWDESLYSAIYSSGFARFWVESVLIFVLMVIALLLPLKWFILVGKPLQPLRPSRWLILSVLVILTSVLVWIHLRVYSITPYGVNSWEILPPPPPPPTWPASNP